MVLQEDLRRALYDPDLLPFSFLNKRVIIGNSLLEFTPSVTNGWKESLVFKKT